MFYRCDCDLEVIAVGVGGPAIFVCPNWLAYCGLRKGGTEGNGLDDSSGNGVMGRTSVHSESTKSVDRRGGPGRGFNGMICESHDVEAVAGLFLRKDSATRGAAVNEMRRRGIEKENDTKEKKREKK